MDLDNHNLVTMVYNVHLAEFSPLLSSPLLFSRLFASLKKTALLTRQQVEEANEDQTLSPHGNNPTNARVHEFENQSLL